MPLSIDPDSFVWVSLATDKAKPEAARPAFKCKFLTVRENLRARALYEDAIKLGETDDAGYVGKILDGILIGVGAWRNLPGEFSRDALQDVLSFQELTELFWLTITETRAVAAELFRSASAPPPASVDSVPTVAAASAPTNPAN